MERESITEALKEAGRGLEKLITYGLPERKDTFEIPKDPMEELFLYGDGGLARVYKRSDYGF